MLTMLAAGTAFALTGSTNAAGDPVGNGTAGLDTGSAGNPGLPQAIPSIFAPPPGGGKTPIPASVITALPGHGNSMALTIDDGASPDVVGAYIKFAKDTGARFTFFVTAYYPSWAIHRDELRPLVDSGQIQLGNHTWDHPDLTRLSGSAIASQLERAKTYLWNNFGVDGAPYYRPPYGRYNAAVNKVAADLGYTVPVMWYGSFGDSGVVTEQYIVESARKYFNAQTIVIGHANLPPVTHVYDQLADIIRERNLSMVTLNDVLIPPG